MARHLLRLHTQNLSCFSLSFFLVLCVFSVVTFLCASHRRKKSHRQNQCSPSPPSDGKKFLTKLSSSIGEKAHLLGKMVSWRKLQGGEGEYDEDDGGGSSEEAVWRKTIIKGERCRPLNFSGKIVYDSQGNLVTDSSHHHHHHHHHQDKSNKVGAASLQKD